MDEIILKNIQAIIFDMDGVLIDSEPLWKIAIEEAFVSVNCQLTKKDFEKTVGLRIDEVIEFWYNEIGWENCSQKELEQKIINRMIELISQNGVPLLGVIETLDFFRKNDFKIGLATSSYKILIETVLKTLNIEDKFDFVHSAEDEKFGKPHPAVYLTVANHLEVNPVNCLVIEDSLTGVIASKSARMRTVCIPEKTHNHNPKLIVADFQFEDMMQFLNTVKK